MKNGKDLNSSKTRKILVKNIYHGQVYSVDETPDQILSEDKCFGIKFDIFKTQFLNENREFKVSVGIRNAKEEFQDDFGESGISDNDE